MEEIKWNQRFNIGVETVDRAHQNLFSIVNKLILLNEDEAKREHACRQGIKYFKSYTIKHFAEEEAFMRKITYEGYDRHKYIHDKMKNRTIPLLEQEMEDEKYSEKSVQHFMGVCIGWLNEHIVVEDRAIVQNNANYWVHEVPGDEESSLGRAVVQAMKKIFQVDANIISMHYSGENFYLGTKVCYRLSYRTEQNTLLQVFFIYEDRQMLRQLGDLLGRPVTRIDQIVLCAMKILSEKFVNDIRMHFPLATGQKLEKSEVITFDQFLRGFQIAPLPYSMLLDTGEYGKFAFCVRL